MIIKPICYFPCRKFVVLREPSQIFMVVSTEYRANVVSLFVCFPHVCLLVKMVSTTVTRSIQLLSEYIRKGYTLRKSLKGLKYKKQKKEN